MSRPRKEGPRTDALGNLALLAQVYQRVHTRSIVAAHLGVGAVMHEARLRAAILPFCISVLRAVRALKHSAEGKEHIRAFRERTGAARKATPHVVDALFLDSYLKANNTLMVLVDGRMLDAGLCFAALAVANERIPRSGDTWSGWLHQYFAPIEAISFGLTLEYAALARAESEAKRDPGSPRPRRESLAEASMAARALAKRRRPGAKVAAENRKREMLEYLRNAVEAEALKTGRPIDSPKRAAGLLTDAHIENVWVRWKRRFANVQDSPHWGTTIAYFRKLYARSYGDKDPRAEGETCKTTGNPDKG